MHNCFHNYSYSSYPCAAKALTVQCKKMEADAKMDSSPMPLLSRLDRLDSVMKYLEGKQKSSNWVIDRSAGRVGKQCVPLNVAVREVKTKGSLLDRITLLEDRLIQLCLEIESSTTSQSHTSTTRSCKETSSGNSSRKYFSCSFPTFEPSQGRRHKSQLPLSRPEHQRKAAVVQQKKQKQNHKETTTPKKQLENSKENKDEKTKSKTGNACIWIMLWHLKLLGCVPKGIV